MLVRAEASATAIVECEAVFDAVLWDFGGVITDSPFDAFRRYEAEHGLPDGFIRGVNTHSPDDNAWARFERNEIDADAFDGAFATESERLGHRVPGADVIALLNGAVRPSMVRLLDDVIAAGYRTACLTNNVIGAHMASADVSPTDPVSAVMRRFHLIVESSKIGRRKPEPEFYLYACAQLDVTPDRCVFLDDLGINLKSARDLGITTIKVTSAEQAEADLRTLLDVHRN